jgi:hypothetical protein
MTFNMGAAARLARSGVVIAGACLTLASAGAAYAQASATTPSPKPPLDSERVAIARQIFDQIGASTLQSMSKAMISSMQAAMTKTVSGLDAQRQQAMMDAVSDAITFVMPKAIDATVDAMAENFDTGQLKDILAFDTSPTGRVMISKMPLIMQQSSATMFAEMPEMVRQMQLRYCAKVTCTASEQQAFAAIIAQVKAHAPG